MSAVERGLLLATLERTGGNRTEAARRLGISVRTVYNKINSYRRSRKQPHFVDRPPKC